MKLNNKGYLIIEVILAGALTFAMAYFLINLTLKVRAGFDDVNVETVLLNDKTVVTNEIMDDVVGNKVKNIVKIDNGIKINFEDGTSKDLTIVNNTITYGTYTKELDKNAIVGDVNIKRSDSYFLIEIPVSTKYSDKDYGINIVAFTEEKYETVSCTLSANGTEITAETSNGLLYYGWDSSYSGENSTTMPISVGEYTYYIKDTMNNISNCSISIVNATASCPSGYNITSNGTQCEKVTAASSYWVNGGSCTCITGNHTNPTVSGSCSGGHCYCGNSGSVGSNSCTYTRKYRCSSGDRSGSSCYSYSNVSQTCPEGYTKVNDTYCSK